MLWDDRTEYAPLFYLLKNFRDYSLMASLNSLAVAVVNNDTSSGGFVEKGVNRWRSSFKELAGAVESFSSNWDVRIFRKPPND